MTSDRENAHRVAVGITLGNFDPNYEYKDQVAGPKTIFSPSIDGKRLRIAQGDNTVELEPEHIRTLPQMASRWIRL